MLSNLGRLMRLCAQAVGRVHSKGTGKRGEFSQEERSYFNKVFVEIIGSFSKDEGNGIDDVRKQLIG